MRLVLAMWIFSVFGWKEIFYSMPPFTINKENNLYLSKVWTRLSSFLAQKKKLKLIFSPLHFLPNTCAPHIMGYLHSCFPQLKMNLCSLNIILWTLNAFYLLKVHYILHFSFNVRCAIFYFPSKCWWAIKFQFSIQTFYLFLIVFSAHTMFINNK